MGCLNSSEETLPEKQDDKPSIPTIKIIILGASGVGKTSILTQYISGVFNENQAPNSGAANMTHPMEVEFNGVQKKVKLDIWDTAGQELYRPGAKQFMKNLDCVVFVYAINNEFTF